jgi:hypothetical protein
MLIYIGDAGDRKWRAFREDKETVMISNQIIDGEKMANP